LNDLWYIASKNPGKLVEFQHALNMLAPPRTRIGSTTFVDLGLDFEIEVEEDGATYGENAAKKAIEIAEHYYKKDRNIEFYPTILADDSGIEVDCLFGRPGLHSARWAGKLGNDNAPVTKLIHEMSGIPERERSARYFCSLALLVPGHSKRALRKTEKILQTGIWNTEILGVKYTLIVTCGQIAGKIATFPRGENGFAYDSYFVDQNGIHLSEYTLQAKSLISHRGRAISNLFARLGESLHPL